MKELFKSINKKMKSSIGEQMEQNRRKSIINQRKKVGSIVQKRRSRNITFGSKDVEAKYASDLYNEEQKEAFIEEILNTSESYLEKNLNAAANNMSLLTLHSIEFTKHFDLQKSNMEMQENVLRNIKAHTTFIAQKSTNMRQRLEQAAAKYGYVKSQSPRISQRNSPNITFRADQQNEPSLTLPKI